MSYHHPLLPETSSKLKKVAPGRNLSEPAATLAFGDLLSGLHEALHRGNAGHVMQSVSLAYGPEAAGHFLGMCQSIYADLLRSAGDGTTLEAVISDANFMLTETAGRMGNQVHWRQDLIERWNAEQANMDADIEAGGR